MTLPTRQQIDGWGESIAHLLESADSYRAAASTLENVNNIHVGQLASPGGTMWHGDAADTAREATYTDRAAVTDAADHLRALARIAENSAYIQQQTHSEVADAITHAEADNFTLSNDLSFLADNSGVRDPMGRMDRNVQANRHLEAITTAAAKLTAHGEEAGQQLTQGAADLMGMTPQSWIQAAGYTIKQDVPNPPPPPPPAPGVINLGDGPPPPKQTYDISRCDGMDQGIDLGLMASGAGLAGSGIGDILSGNESRGWSNLIAGVTTALGAFNTAKDCMK